LFGPVCPFLRQLSLKVFVSQQSCVHLPRHTGGHTTAKWSVNAANLVSTPGFLSLKLCDVYILSIPYAPRLV
jgi:hypothetical protein